MTTQFHFEFQKFVQIFFLFLLPPHRNWAALTFIIFSSNQTNTSQFPCIKFFPKNGAFSCRVGPVISMSFAMWTIKIQLHRPLCIHILRCFCVLWSSTWCPNITQLFKHLFLFQSTAATCPTFNWMPCFFSFLFLSFLLHGLAFV